MVGIALSITSGRRKPGDMSRFPTEHHLASWGGMCPGQRESGDKSTPPRHAEAPSGCAALTECSNGVRCFRGGGPGRRSVCQQDEIGGDRNGEPFRSSAYAIRYTKCVAKIVPAREFRTKLSELLSDVADRRDHVLVTRNGKPAAALVPIDEYEALEETAEILSDSPALAAIEAGLADLARGDSVTLDDLRRELTERRAAR